MFDDGDAAVAAFDDSGDDSGGGSACDASCNCSDS